MDDIKLYASKEHHLQNLIQTTVAFSNDIRMEFGIDKCRTIHVTKGKHELVGFDLPSGEIIVPMEEGATYRYLGFHQSRDICHGDIKRTLQKSYTDRLDSHLKTRLNGRNLIKAINTYAVPVLTYSFGIIKWYGLRSVRQENTYDTHKTQNTPSTIMYRTTDASKVRGRQRLDGY